jgi:lipopolysaccharide export LptBFGC system permease protein LptF
VQHHVEVFCQGIGTFTETRFENGQSISRIHNQGEGFFIKNNFSSLEEAKAYCERKLENNASLIFYIMRGKDIIDYVQNDAYQLAKEKKEDRIYTAASTIVVVLLASSVSVFIMPFQTMIYHVFFIGGMGAFYLLLYSAGGRWNLESVVATIILLVLLSVVVPLLAK